ncbi:MAG: DUF3821 domain-containing protein [Methanomicrobiales archaeon]|nr:DUF3821 domain-containing protein [Methanomicrobiales archaeon]
MATKHPIYWISLALFVALWISPVSAAINTIAQGGTVFVGEQNLDVSAVMDGDTKIGWWASGAAINGSAPSYSIFVSNPTGFYVQPSDFTSRLGVWYRLTPSNDSNGTAFSVVDPQLSIRIEDTTVNVDVTNKWVPTEDQLRFRIDTNLVPIGQRAGVTSVPITIKVQGPDGAVYSSLLNTAGTATSIVDIPVSTTPYYTASIWNTSQRDAYAPGTYTIWAECNANSMKDNYSPSGKAISEKVTLLNQDNNPLIRGNYPTQATTAATPKPVVTTAQPTTVKTTATAVPTTAAPVTTVTTPVPTTEVPTQVPVSTVPPATPTKSPGFEGTLAGIAVLGTMLVFWKKN